jgi:hypothetical protein
MSSYNYYGSHGHPTPISAAPVTHSSHGRSRRAPGRLSVGSQNSHKQYRGSPRSLKELAESQSFAAARSRFEVTRSFDLEDDMEFCPSLCSQLDVSGVGSESSRTSSPTNWSHQFDAVSIASSERSSLASSSPESSPTQQPQTVAPVFSLNSSSPPFIPPAFQSQQSSLKLHQPSATRARNAIPIINPSTGATMSSPPPSVSPARMHQHTIGRRW